MLSMFKVTTVAMLILLASSVQTAVYAATHAHDNLFELEPDLVKKIVNERQRKKASLHTSTLAISAELSQFNVLHLLWENNYYAVQYAGQIDTINVIRVRLTRPLQEKVHFSLKLITEAAFGYKQGIFKVIPKQGTVASDSLTLQMVPLSLGLVIQPKRALPLGLGARFFTTALATYVSQRGRLDGITQAFWAPGWRAGMHVVLGQNDGPQLDRWFAGIHAGLAYESTSETHVDWQGWATEMGIAVKL